MGDIKYSVVNQDFTYPLNTTEIGEEPVLDANGEPLTRKEIILDKDGQPQITLELLPDPDTNGAPLMAKRFTYIDVPVTQKIYEAMPDVSADPDGVMFSVKAWDEDNPKAFKLFTFHIGKSAFQALSSPDERKHIIGREVEIQFKATLPPVEQDWTQGVFA